jgi:hypothetical protein
MGGMVALFATGAAEFVSLYDLLVTHTWWQYRASGSLNLAYHCFNLLEGTIWLIFALLVLARFVRWRRSWLEIVYATMFFAFGLTDFREAYRLESWLILLKGANLVLLLWLRREVIRRAYPAAKIY